MHLWERLRRLPRADRDLDDEIRAHLAMAAQDRTDRGETPGDAHRQARREFGNELHIRETTREVWVWTAAERFAHDLKYALRQMRRTPAFSAIAILTLALGLGATTAMFSIVNGVLLDPLHYRDPARLYLARTVPPARAHLTGDFPINARHYYEWRTRCRSCESAALVQFQELTLVGAGAPVKLPALGVSSNFFRTLGIQPALGRDFLDAEDAPGHPAVVILTDSLWRSRFAADPAVLGRTVRLNGETYTVIGVMPPGLHLPKGDEWGAYFGPSAQPLIFLPTGIDTFRAARVGNLNYTSVIRLRPGIAVQQAIGELNALLGDFVREFHLETRITLVSLQQQVTRNARAPLWLLLATVAAVLLIVCVNVGNLMVVRTGSRYREAGIRMALGSSRGQLFRLVLTEVLVLVAIGGALGLALAWLGLHLFLASAPIALPRLEEVTIDWRVLSFAGLAIAVSTLFCGLFPAWRVARVEVHDSLKAGASAATESAGKLRVREILVGLEIALSTVLLVSGGLLMLSFFRIMHVERGFEVAHIVTQDVSFLNPKYAHGFRRRFVEQVLEKLSALPGVHLTGATNLLPLRGDDWVSDLEDPDAPPVSVDHAALANFRFVTSDYLQAMGIPLRMGRFLDASDKDQPHAVISARAAEFLWPNQNPLGKRVRGATASGPGPSLEVVGVVGEVRSSGLERTPPNMVYEHYWRMQPIGMSFVLRTRGDPAAAAGAIRSILTSADPEMALPRPASMEAIVEESVASRRFQMNLTVAFALAALLIAALGVYGVISFAVARRTPEIGVRIALGATRPQLMRLIFRQGMRPVLAGLAAGIVGALALGRMIASQLFAVEPSDPIAIAAVALLLLVVAGIACWLPARRATRIDPLTALRFE
jgi:putative ABC transport system permease protein